MADKPKGPPAHTPPPVLQRVPRPVPAAGAPAAPPPEAPRPPPAPAAGSPAGPPAPAPPAARSPAAPPAAGERPSTSAPGGAPPPLGRGLPGPEITASAAIAAGLAHQGSLAKDSPLHLYYLATAAQAAGRLTVGSERGGYTLTFKKGVVEHAASTYPQDDLGQFLVKRGVVGEVQLAQAREARAKFGGDLVSALVGLRLIDPAATFQVLQEHGAGMVWRALAAEGGTWRWEPGEPPPPSSFPLGSRWGMFCDAVRRFDAPGVGKRLGPRAGRVATRVGGRVEITDLKLTSHEVRVCALFDGVRTVEEIAAAVPAEVDLVRRMALLLAEAELLAFSDRRGTAATARPSGRPSATSSAPRPAAGPAAEAKPVAPGAAAASSAAPGASAAPTQAVPGAVPAPPPAVPRAAAAPPPAARAAPPPAAQAAPPSGGASPREPAPPPSAKAPPAAPGRGPAAPGPPRPAVTPVPGQPPTPAPRPAPTPAPAATHTPIPVVPVATTPAALEALRERMAQAADHFEVLGLKRGAAPALIKAAYFQFAKAYHPDTASPDDAPEVKQLRADVFARAGEAWEVLGDDQKRVQYLEELKTGAAQVDVMAILHAENLFQMATVLVKTRRYDEALQKLEEAVKLNADEPEFAVWRAWVQFILAPKERKTARHAAAAQVIEAALKRNPRCMPAYLFLGQMAKLMGDAAAAERAWKRGLAVDERNVDLQRELRYSRK